MSRPKWREDAEHLKRLIKEARARRGKGHNRGRDIREIRRMLSAKFYEIDDPVHEILPFRTTSQESCVAPGQTENAATSPCCQWAWPDSGKPVEFTCFC